MSADKCFASFSATLHVFCKYFAPIWGDFPSSCGYFMHFSGGFPSISTLEVIFDYFVSLFYYLGAVFSSFCTNFRLFLLLVLHISFLSKIVHSLPIILHVFNHFTPISVLIVSMLHTSVILSVSLCGNFASLLVVCLFYTQLYFFVVVLYLRTELGSLRSSRPV